MGIKNQISSSTKWVLKNRITVNVNKSLTFQIYIPVVFDSRQTNSREIIQINGLEVVECLKRGQFTF